MIEVGQLVRKVGASAERAIEDELDWKHLPYTHASTFSAATLIHEDASSFEADVVLADGTPMRMRVTIDDDALGYTNSTYYGDVENGRAVCRIVPGGPDACEMSLRFFVPDGSSTDLKAAGDFYVGLFNRLIDEDEPKMIYRTQALRNGPAAHKARRTVTLQDGSEHAVPLVCPHQGLPLDCEPNAEGIMQCPWHGYQFDVRTGVCVSGQLKGWR
jgi:nitrite reductase/ring-hydroxylating ferredoxin subunit